MYSFRPFTKSCFHLVHCSHFCSALGAGLAGLIIGAVILVCVVCVEQDVAYSTVASSNADKPQQRDIFIIETVCGGI
jgi:hypothetical protein